MGGQRRAVIIGINKYDDEKIAPLAGAVNDATELRDILRDRGGFTIRDGHDFLIDKDASGERIRRAISDLFWNTEKCEIALFFFAGHGRRDHLENGFLLPWNAKQHEPFVHGIDLQELKRLFLQARISIKTTGVLILDCCYSGIATKAERDGGGQEDKESIAKLYQALSLDFKAEDRAPELESKGSGRYILASADADKTAREVERKHFGCNDPTHAHGYFSFHLIEGLQSLAEEEDHQVSLGGLIRYIDRAFSSEGKKWQRASSSADNQEMIFLARTAAKTQEFIEKRCKEIEDLLRQETTRNTISAARYIVDLEKRNHKNDNIDALRTRVKNQMEEIRILVNDWWLDNNLDLPVSCRETKGWKTLEKAARDFQYDKIRDFNNRSLSILIECAQDIQDKKSVKDIGNYIMLLERDDRTRVGVGDATPKQKAASTAGQDPGPLNISGP